MLARRRLLLAGAVGVGAVIVGCAPGPGGAPPAPTPGPPPAAGPSPLPSPGPIPAIGELERDFRRRLGVVALDTATGAAVAHRAEERFVMCSVVKALMAGFALHRSVDDPTLLSRPVRWTEADLLEHAPATRPALTTGLTVEQLCDAAVTVSDNTAHNLLLREVGPPADLTAWLRTLGDDVTRADRTETALNVRDGDLDTTTPAALTATLRALTVGDALPAAERARLVGWLRANTTGDAQIRAGLPAGWAAGEKTGSGPGGEKNDAGVLFGPHGRPVMLTVLTVADDPDDAEGSTLDARAEEAIAATTRAALAALGR